MHTRKLLPFALILISLAFGCDKSEQPVAQDNGLLQISLTSRNARLVNAAKFREIVLTITELEARRDGGDWIRISSEKTTVDLLQIQDTESLLGQGNLKNGRYTGLRMYIPEGFTVMDDGSRCDLRIPSQRAYIDMDFTIQTGQITGVLLDFNSDESIHIVDRGKTCTLRPVIHVAEVR